MRASSVVIGWVFSICLMMNLKAENLDSLSKANQGKPNVVFILADQWRAQELGYAGSENVLTPNLDALAEESLVFHNAVSVSPVCTPWRASFLTGQYPLTNGIFYNDKPLPTEAITAGKIYKNEGYATGYIGKWHLNGHPRGEDAFAARELPIPKERRQGFDYWKVREVTHNYNNSFYFDENDVKHTWEGYDVFPQTDSAISFINKNTSNPFFLMLSYGPPHDPYFTAPEEFKKLYNEKNIKLRPNVPEELQDSARHVLAGYYAHCSAIDKAIGDLLKALDNAGLKDNTIIVFSSEHGDMLLSKGVLKKQRPWDESIKVPLLIRYPEMYGQERKDFYDPINTPDLLPTLLGMSNIKKPKSIEGKDFSRKMILGSDLENEAALVMLPVPFHEWKFMNGGREYRAIRTKRYTYVKDLLGPWLLYDNEKDPYQMNNLVGKEEASSLQKEMEEILQAKLKKTNDKFLPADEYMKMWNYLYDSPGGRSDSLRLENYLEINRN